MGIRSGADGRHGRDPDRRQVFHWNLRGTPGHPLAVGSWIEPRHVRRVSRHPFPPFPPSIQPPIVPSSTPQKLRYEEQDLLVTVNQLVGDEWSFGARYQLSYSNLHTIFSDIPTAVVAGADHREKATLHQGQLFALYNHRSGFFAQLEGYWARQSNVGYAPDIPGDEIFQANAYIGYRFRRNFGDVTLGFLNMTDQDYQLNPLNYYNELPRERTLVARVRLNF